jgi:carboxymethylenebutenolidase
MTETVTITGEHSSFQCILTVPQQGSGPGLIFISENYNITKEIEQEAIQLSEEGYVVLVPDLSKISNNISSDDDDKMILYIKSIITYLNKIPKKVGKIGIIGRGYGGYIILKLFESLTNLIDCIILYYPKNIINYKIMDNIKIPFMIHLIDNDNNNDDDKLIYEKFKDLKNNNKFIEVYKYPNVKYGFASINENFDKSSSGIAYSRSLSLLKRTIGPLYDLSALWDKHIEYEFETRDVHKTMKTMVINNLIIFFVLFLFEIKIMLHKSKKKKKTKVNCPKRS